MFDKIRDPEFIKRVRTSKEYAPLREKYEKTYSLLVKDEPLSCKFSKFRLFAEKGERNLYEQAFNQHVDKLGLSAYRAIIYGDEYLPDLEDALYDIFQVAINESYCVVHHSKSKDESISFFALP